MDLGIKADEPIRKQPEPSLPLWFWAVAAVGVAILLGLVLLVSREHREPTQQPKQVVAAKLGPPKLPIFAVGDDCQVVGPSDKRVYVATDMATWRQFIDAQAAGDDAGIAELKAAEAVSWFDGGTRVKVLHVYDGAAEVRALDSIDRGKQAIIALKDLAKAEPLPYAEPSPVDRPKTEAAPSAYEKALEKIRQRDAEK